MEQKVSSAARSGTPQGMKDAMKKATTEMLVLFMLRQKTMYSYEMMQEIARLTDGVLTFNTLYLAVYRLQDHGYIVEQEKRIVDGRARAYLAITEAGRTYLAQAAGAVCPDDRRNQCPAGAGRKTLWKRVSKEKRV